MNATTTALRRQMLEWIAVRPRNDAEVMESWRTSCPSCPSCPFIDLGRRFDGLIDYEPDTGKVILSDADKAFLSTKELATAKSTPGSSEMNSFSE
jgi:hypothetical protein